MRQTVDALWICSFLQQSTRVWIVEDYIHICVRPLQVCSFYYTGQFQSLYAENGQQVRLSRFFV